MSLIIRALTQHNQQDAIDLLNQSSKGTSLQYDLDIFGFRWLARYWNFSYEHSLISYMNEVPAALMLNCVDPDAHDAYTFYWGAPPQFRKGGIALSLVEASCRMLRDQGYTMHYAAALPDRPVRRYRFVQFKPECDLIDMQAQALSLPEPDPRFVVREVTVDDLPEPPLPPGEYRHWCQRARFLRHAAPFVKIIASFAGDEIEAYAVILPQFPHQAVTDIRATHGCSAAAYELLRWLTLQPDYRPPTDATYVSEQSFSHRLLTDAGFSFKRRFSVLSRDLSSNP